MSYRQNPVLTALMILGLGLCSGIALAQQDHSGHQPGHQPDTQDQGDQEERMTRGGGQGGAMNRGDGGGRMNRGGDGGGMMRGGRGNMGAAAPATAPTGQSAFTVIQDVIAQLQANPETDWTRINIAALRQHLVDMDRVVMMAEAEVEPIDGGNRYLVSGPDSRTVEAIQRMVPTHALQMGRELDWQISTRLRDDGVELSLSAAQTDEAAKIRGLGFFGFMALGDHHADHHLMMAGGRAADAAATMAHDTDEAMDHSQH